MKIRVSYVTNSSSSSYIICFARIVDKEKAYPIIDKYGLEVFDAAGVNGEKNWYGDLGADYCGAIIYGVDNVLKTHPDDKYVIIQDRNEACYDEDCEPIYDYDFYMNDAIEEITEENGFADIECAEGEGFDG